MRVETRFAQTAIFSFPIFHEAQIALSKMVKVKNDITVDTNIQS